MIAYYESKSLLPPTHILPVIAKALEVTADQLLGMERMKKNGRTANTRLHRRLQQLEELGAKEKRQIMQFLDTFIEREQLKRKVQGAA